MSSRRLAAALAAAASVVVLGVTIGAAMRDQFPSLPRRPQIPGVSRPAQATGLDCSDITEEQLDKFLTAKRVEAATLKSETDAANARRAAAQAQLDAGGQRRATVMLGEVMKNAECTDAFKERDPRSREIARLYSLAEAASGRGDEAKAEEYQNKASQLESALDLEADRSCGGKGVSALMDCIAKKKPVLAQQGVTEPMLTVQAQGECMSDPATSGIPGMTGDSAQEKAAQAALSDANNALANAQENARKAGANASGLDDEQMGRITDCICAGTGPGYVTGTTTAASRAALQRRQTELRRAAGCS